VRRTLDDLVTQSVGRASTCSDQRHADPPLAGLAISAAGSGPGRHGVLLFAVVLLDMIGFGIVIPILPFITPRLGGGSFDIALIIVTYSVFAGLVGPVWGRLSDRIGRKPVLMLCTAGGASAYLLLAGADGLWMVYAARACAGLAGGQLPRGLGDDGGYHRRVGTRPGHGHDRRGLRHRSGARAGARRPAVRSRRQLRHALPAGGAACRLLAVPPPGCSCPSRTASGSRTPQPRRPLWDMIRASQSRLLLLQYALHTGSVSAVTYLFPLWVLRPAGLGAREVGIVFGVVGASWP
jgi:DHA1 family tetracycline resistance protein-like MFS transporter